MPDETPLAPADYETVMVSRSFSEFEEHRAALVVILQSSGLKVAMLSHHELTAAGVIETSLKLVPTMRKPIPTNFRWSSLSSTKPRGWVARCSPSVRPRAPGQSGRKIL
jgi:hypothetical protein